mgnify:CR=1 FL=1
MMSYKNGVLTIDPDDAQWTRNDMGERGPILPRTASGYLTVSWAGKDGKWRETEVGLLRHLDTGRIEVSEYPGGFRILGDDGEVAGEKAFRDGLSIVFS